MIEVVEYRGWKSNLKLSNAACELVVTLDVGPRVIAYRLPGGFNVMKNYDAMMGGTGEPEWQIRGGHRFWLAPEDLTRTYFPDNRPVNWTNDNGTAVRYGVGIGAAGFEWSGRAHIAYKREWPTWTPPAEMIKRQPELEKWRRGMPPGIDNPLGARSLYIHQANRDTLYRIHGTGEAHTIGKAVSSGCVRLLHQDIIDLHQRVRSGSTLVVMSSAVA